MTCNFLSLLFFCSVCVSAFGQELQSPQINQNAIFANPGLAGSKGQTRVCGSTGIFRHSDYGYLNNSLIWKTQSPTYHTSSLSIDGLVFNKSIGLGAYIQKTSLKNNEVHSYYSGASFPSDTIIKSIYDSKYYQLAIGVMIAPKFYLKSLNIKKTGRSISPSFAIGIRNNNSTLDYTYTRNTTLSDTVYTSEKKDAYFSLNNISAGLLYNTTKGYSGIKVGLNTTQQGSFTFMTSFVFAHSFFNKNNSQPNFSFNPHGYISLYWLNFGNRPNLNNEFNLNLGTSIAVNLDFRYKKLIFGTYYYNTYSKYNMPGVMAGIQLKTIRIAANVSPNLTKSEATYSGYFSINYLIPTKNNQ